eukprot:2400239-Amphidinium_carterae.1
MQLQARVTVTCIQDRKRCFGKEAANRCCTQKSDAGLLMLCNKGMFLEVESCQCPPFQTMRSVGNCSHGCGWPSSRFLRLHASNSSQCHGTSNMWIRTAWSCRGASSNKLDTSESSPGLAARASCTTVHHAVVTTCCVKLQCQAECL